MNLSWSFTLQILPQLLSGMVVTIEATFVGMALALVIGLVLVLGRRSRYRMVAGPVRFVIEFIRSTPLLVQLYFIFFVFPDIGIRLGPFLAGVIALGLHYGCYISEVYRSGIDNIPKGQWEAAISLDLTKIQTYRDIILPQAVPPILPLVGNYLISMFKDTPLLSAITVLEMLERAKMIGSESFHYFEPLTIVGILFLVLSVLSSIGVRKLEKLLPKGGFPLK
ncbi:MAG TPA: ectoine/hydroxyectoine ABC transporter permease subunit EhuD [Spirochaetia bacterium]|nr:ectoine/hydroxyectoine ABC transporter permease subunit EhuD [Spirochaetia bacterium]